MQSLTQFDWLCTYSTRITISRIHVCGMVRVTVYGYVSVEVLPVLEDDLND